jgi:hypothetical protein
MNSALPSFMQDAAKTPPPVLDHYTSLDALQKIVMGGAIWASDLRYLNDTTEYLYLIDIVIARGRELIGSRTEAS